MPFLTPAIMRPYGDNKWAMVEDFDYQYGSKIIRIPHGFVHDLASIPRPLNLFVRQSGRHREAAILHDWLYENKGLINSFKRFSRKESDEIFYQAMLESGVGNVKSYLMYKAVRIGGYFAWKS
jgi:hypothetical protein